MSGSRIPGPLGLSSEDDLLEERGTTMRAQPAEPGPLVLDDIGLPLDEPVVIEAGARSAEPYPELLIDWHNYPNLADNIWQAQMAGWPKVLTYNGPDLSLRRAQRRSAMHYEHAGDRYEIPRILSRDEYPFACTAEGGGVWVGHIPARENSAQGGMIAGFLRRHRITANCGEQSKFVVTVINHPKGPVTR